MINYGGLLFHLSGAENLTGFPEKCT